ncbi:hypothetical protein FBU30_000794 [Linnemannia zychae]|nr:hypothetical protein FBU30_000794 [Linnemannia zychae]
MTHDSFQEQEQEQAFRSVDKTLPPSSIPLPNPDDIRYLECHIDPVNQKLMVLWDDIIQAFPTAVQVRNKTKVLPFLKGVDFKALEPPRIAAVPGMVLDVVVDKSIDDVAASFSHVLVTPPSSRRNPTYGLEDEAMETYKHIEAPISTSTARGLQALIDKNPPTIAVDPPVNPQISNDAIPHPRGPQAISTTISMETQLAHLFLGANQGNKDDQASLGDMYKNGRGGVERDYKAAMYWFLKAVEQEDATSQYQIGDMYYFGLGVTQDYSKAMTWFREAANQGHVIAQFYIGELYKSGYGVKKDILLALSWFHKAADQGYEDAQHNIGYLYLTGNGVQKDFSTALYWFHKAADQGHANSQYHIASLYTHGLGVKKNHSTALKWYLKAADQNHLEAQLNIAAIYRNGHGVEQDFSRAMFWFRKLADQGIPAAQFNVGYLYNFGGGVEQDFGAAVAWYRKAADQGYSNAQRNLARLYEAGDGVPQDLSIAKMWYQMAAEQGHVSAMAALERIKKSEAA